MSFSNIIFIFVFVPLFMICYFAVKKRSLRNLVLLLGSAAFVIYGEPTKSLIIFGLLVVNYFAVKLIKKDFVKKVLIALNVISLFIFKYCDLTMPMGYSFFVFTMISFLADYKDEEVTFGEFAIYNLSFTHFISGPIVRFKDNIKEIKEREENFDLAAEGIRLFIVGLAMKCLIANPLNEVCSSIFGYNLSELGFIETFTATVSYTLQIYYDFAGYSNMAIGLAKVLGFNYKENFDYPYISKSVTEFWRRWHISLSSFFRDYVYIPLGGNRCSKVRHIFNLLVVWVLTGLWHGSTKNFLVWGLYYFVILVMEKYLTGKLLEKLPAVLQHLISLVLVAFGWVIFYFVRLSDIFQVAKNLLFINGLGKLSIMDKLQVLSPINLIVLIAAIVFAMPHKKKDSTLKDILLIILFVISVVSLLNNNYNPFIYFNF